MRNKSAAKVADAALPSAFGAIDAREPSIVSEDAFDAMFVIDTP